MISMAFVLGAIVGFLMAPGIRERKHYYFQGFEECQERTEQEIQRLIAAAFFAENPGNPALQYLNTAINKIRELRPEADEEK